MKNALLWLRRDLRLFDHAALHHALASGATVYCAFIFDRAILDCLPAADRRVEFLHDTLAALADELAAAGGHLIVRHDFAETAIPALAAELDCAAVYANHDYEPAASARDAAVAAALAAAGRTLHTFKDQVVFERDEVLTQAGQPFTVFTPYKNAWLRKLEADPAVLAPWTVAPQAGRFAPGHSTLPALEALGFARTNLHQLGIGNGPQLFDDFLGRIADYGVARDFPAIKGPSYLSMHLRFGTVSIRHLVRTVMAMSARGAAGEGGAVWLSELIWREFYMQILFHHPHVVSGAFKPAYDRIEWESGPEADQLFAAWCEGRTGYPLVDAAMLQLNGTGYMHNRLRMVTASFLCKDLGIDWRRGEAYFALHLNDFDLAANNGGWQWAASSGCDAQPYFRIFNPVTQSQKFDPEGKFIKRYLPQLAGLSAKEIHLPRNPVVEHDAARQRTLARYAVVKTR
ncbi:MAG: deoxyribodipyrimidine photolyase [Pseudoduganella sp.]|jgi:deoxyribodipyrimidine photo-lyase|nr:deoxyribodipyrimidine photolyase [Pseudoduganella sp.]